MQITSVRSKEKDYDIYLKSKKKDHSQQEHDKNVSQLFGSGKNLFLAISSLTNTVAAIWREKKVVPCYKKCSSLLGAAIHSQQGHEKMFPNLEVEKIWFLAISSLTNTVAAIWREKKVDPCYLEIKKCSSQLLGARSTKNMFPSYLEVEKTGSQLFRA